MITPISLLALIGLLFLFLAAFQFNFARISSGWFGLALINLAIVLPGFALSSNTLVLIVLILVIVLLIILITDRFRRPPTA